MTGDRYRVSFFGTIPSRASVRLRRGKTDLCGVPASPVVGSYTQLTTFMLSDATHWLWVKNPPGRRGHQNENDVISASTPIGAANAGPPRLFSGPRIGMGIRYTSHRQTCAHTRHRALAALIRRSASALPLATSRAVRPASGRSGERQLPDHARPYQDLPQRDSGHHVDHAHCFRR